MIAIRGELTLADHAAVIRELAEPRRTRIRAAVGCCGAVMIGVSVLAGPIMPVAGIDGLPFLGAALVLNVVLASPLRFRRYVAKQYAQMVARSATAVVIDVDAEGITSRDALDNPVFLPWAQVEGWRDRPGNVFVFFSRLSGLVIPDRWLSPERRADLRELLARSARRM